jgi:Fe-coproporphyrin III synthase
MQSKISDMASEMMTGGSEKTCNTTRSSNVIHIHPTLRCNLRCKHCYSSSAPNLKGGIELELLKPFLEYAFETGFNIVSISGGEPFLYDQLKDLLVESKKIGFRTQIASNGMLLKASKSQECLEYIDLIAISIDGTEEEHDQIRCLKGAFKKTVEGIQILNDHQKPFGMIHTITNESWKNLLWLSEFASNRGAKLLQLHPLELDGRAKETFSMQRLTQESLHKTHVLGTYLQSKYAESMRIQMDFLHREYIAEYPTTVHFQGNDFLLNEDNFADSIKTVVVNEKGGVLPVSYGFSNDFEICNLRDFSRKNQMFQKFIQGKGGKLYSLITECYHEILNDEQNDLVAWTEYIVAKSNGEK